GQTAEELVDLGVKKLHDQRMREADGIIDAIHLRISFEHTVGKDELVVPEQEIQAVGVSLRGEFPNLFNAAVEAPPDGSRFEFGKRVVLQKPGDIDAAFASAPHELQRVDAVAGRFLDGAGYRGRDLLDGAIESAAERKIKIGLESSRPPFANRETRRRGC